MLLVFCAAGEELNSGKAKMINRNPDSAAYLQQVSNQSSKSWKVGAYTSRRLIKNKVGKAACDLGSAESRGSKVSHVYRDREGHYGRCLEIKLRQDKDKRKSLEV